MRVYGLRSGMCTITHRVKLGSRVKRNNQFPVADIMKTTIQHARRLSPIHAAILSLTLCLAAGCSKQGETPATQVVAKVNGDEISIHQVNNALAQAGNVSPENVDAVRHEVLDKLINQQLAVQQAEERKLDRSTEVMMKIDAAKREILTRAYLGQVVASLPKPSEEEAKTFYQEHPALFSQRRIYNLHEIVIQNPHPPTEDMRQLIAGKSPDQIATELKQRNIAFNTSSGTRSAEQIALPILSGLADIKDGETGLVETPEALVILHVDTSRDAPVSEEAAMQHIPQYLANDRAKKAISEELERLKAKADIEYLDQTASAKAAAGKAQASNPSVTATKAAAVKPQPAEADAQSSTAKGIAGL